MGWINLSILRRDVGFIYYPLSQLQDHKMIRGLRPAAVIGPMRLIGPILIFILACQTARAYPISLDGYWRYELDPADAGVQQQWFSKPLRYPIQMPGIVQSQLFSNGNEITTDTPW